MSQETLFGEMSNSIAAALWYRPAVINALSPELLSALGAPSEEMKRHLPQ